MGLRDVSGVFSRFFITGFFVPAFFTLCALALALSARFRPAEFDAAKRSDQILVLGGLALLLGLTLLGLRYRITRVFEGYDLTGLRVAEPLASLLVKLQQRSRARLAAAGGSPAGTAWRLDRRFPDEEERLLPTRFGNAMRASEDHAYKRWGLDHIAIWPRMDVLLSEQERELHANAKSDLSFFMNLTLGAVVLGVLLIVDELLGSRAEGAEHLYYLAPFAAAVVLYRFAVGAAERWGTEQRATVDLHRLELYDRLGVRRPLSFSDERRKIAPAVNRCLLRAEPIPDDLYGGARKEEKT